MSPKDVLSRDNSDPHFHTASAFISTSAAEINDEVDNSLQKAVANSYYRIRELVISDDWLSEIEERTFGKNTFLFVHERIQAFGECHNFIKNGNVLINISRDDRLGCSDNQFNQIISTFRFLDSK